MSTGMPSWCIACASLPLPLPSGYALGWGCQKIAQPSKTKTVWCRHPLWLPKFDGQYINSLDVNVYRHILLGQRLAPMLPGVKGQFVAAPPLWLAARPEVRKYWRTQGGAVHRERRHRKTLNLPRTKSSQFVAQPLFMCHPELPGPLSATYTIRGQSNDSGLFGPINNTVGRCTRGGKVVASSCLWAGSRAAQMRGSRGQFAN
mmetsp:Transcript_126198/g.218625  ORF Transcript_126198/g.218625 Transcript_126198/m.218625 type:complete len:203 (-) Transcript_126198:2419-3027(-)